MFFFITWRPNNMLEVGLKKGLRVPLPHSEGRQHISSFKGCSYITQDM